MTQKVPGIIAVGLFVFTTGFGSVAQAQLVPFPGTKILVSGLDPVGIGKDVPTEFTFEITLNANNFDATNTVMDVVPAEFDVVSLEPDCGMAESVEGKGHERGGKPGGKGDRNFKLAPDFIVWDLEGCDITIAQTLTVVIQTDLNPGHAKRGIVYYEPTSCGPLFLNDGAVLISGDSDEASTEPSNALMIAACPDEEDLEACVDTDQDGLSVGCGDNEDCQPSEEICDGLDNDCDGAIDEDLGQTTCGLGECQHTIDDCVDGVLQTCDPFGGTMPEICDGLDNDCDGAVDEGLGQMLCGLGECEHTIDACVNGVPQVCDPFAGAGPEICDGLDNDCDGLVDEDQGQTTCGLGPCQNTIDNCVNGVEQICDPFGGGEDEICDGIDNDCDGLVDEDQGQTTCGLGECNHTIDNCVNGVQQTCDPFEGALPEICDGLDNDCDGSIDEDNPGGGAQCGSTDVGVCEFGAEQCQGGQLMCVGSVEPGSEICDGLDNDCDGLVDEGFGQVTCGLGVCQVTVDECVDGQPQECVPNPGSLFEFCGDGLDNNCNGEVDEGCGGQ